MINIDTFMHIKIDEGLPYNHREDMTRKILSFCETGECFVLLGDKGLGKSKYLRHVANSSSFKKSYLDNLNIEFVYVNLNEIFTLSAEQFLNILLSTKTAQKIDQIEQYLENLNGKYYLILDQSELLPILDDEIHRILTSLIVKFKRKFAVIFSANFLDFSKQESLDYINQHTTATLLFTPQSTEQILITVQQFKKTYNLALTNEQELLLAKKSKGSPLFVKQVLITIKSGDSFEKSLKKYLSLDKKELDNNNAKTETEDLRVREFRKFFTKNQYLFFVELLKHINQIVDRNELAIILSPESGGSGVSNNAVDQTINRLRQILTKENLPYQIISKRGVGYLMKNLS